MRPQAFLCCLALWGCGDDPEAGEEADYVAPDRTLDAGAPLDARGELDARRAPEDATAVPDALVEADAGREPVLRVRVESGELQGKLEYDTRLFLGIPFAKPPVGALRFRPPEPEAPWQGVREVTEAGPACIQAEFDAKPPFSEDCLTLNVFAPAYVASDAPVMVFLHGGGGIFGTGANYPSHWLATPHGVVVVTVNYRLGPLASLVHPTLDSELGLPSGNLSLRDQLRALQWVKQNIGAFGGDAGNVTVFGQSYGSMSTCMLMFVEQANGLMHRAIMESGACIGFGEPYRRERMLETSQSLVDRLCPGRADVASCLREVPAQAFAASPLELTAWWPYIDGQLLRDSTRALLRADAMLHVPFILGWNVNEWRVNERVGGFPGLGSLLEMQLFTSAMYPEDAPALLAHYLPAQDVEAGAAFSRMMTDGMFACPSQLFGRDARARGHVPYLYRFDVTPGGHSQELDYVFGWPAGGVSEAQYAGEAPYPTLRDVIDTTQGYWTQFARTGDPNGGTRPRWSPFVDELMTLSATPRAVAKVDQGCAVWEQHYLRSAR